MIRIECIRLREIHLPLKEPFQISSGVVQNRRILLVQVIDADGAEGWGECVAGEYPNYHPETIDTAWLAIREWIAPKLFEREFERPADIYPWLQRDIRGHHMAKAGVEMSAWELAARKAGQSLSRFIGGTRGEIAVGISIGIQPSPEALVQKVREAVSAGYRKAKIKIKPGADVEYVRAVREALGNDVPIMVDANNAYTLADLERLRALDEFNLMMIEQPLAWDDLLQHARLQRELRTPVCLDESITGVDRARDMIELGAGKIINIKPGRVGGFTSSKQIHDLCAENGIPVWCGGMLESGVGRAHNVALASLSNFTLPGDVSPSSRYWQRDIVQPEWQMDEQGMIAVPMERPGMGVELDMDYIEHLTVRQLELTR